MHYETKAVRDNIKRRKGGVMSIGKELLELFSFNKKDTAQTLPHIKKGQEKKEEKCKLTYCLIVHNLYNFIYIFLYICFMSIFISIFFFNLEIFWC